MKKFEKINNYLVVTETDTGVVEIDHPSRDIVGSAKNGVVHINNISFNRDNPLKVNRYYPEGSVSATGSVQLTGGSGTVNGITVNGVQIMSGAVAFNTDLATTASDVAANINAFTSSPNYTAVVVGDTITITDTVGGNGANGFAVVSSTTTMGSVDTNMSGGGLGILKTGDVPFDDDAEIVAFFRTNTGA